MSALPPDAPGPAEIERARRAGDATVRTTPVLDGSWIASELDLPDGRKVLLKAECFQHTGSFKVRGVSSCLAAHEPAPKGVVAASAGNHGQALAFVAAKYGIPARVYVPATASVSKAQAIRAYGAELEVGGSSVDECQGFAHDFAAREGALLVHPFDDPDVIAGQATLGIEILEQVPDVARIVVPVGGGGLVAGIASAVKRERPEAEIIGVQADVCAPFHGAFDEATDLRFALADGIAIKRPGELTGPLVERLVDRFETVSEDQIAESMVALTERGKLVAEGAGAVAVAALRAGLVEPAAAGPTVAVVSGGNVDMGRLLAVIRAHEAISGRRVHVSLLISDEPGGLARLLTVIAAAAGNVVSIQHMRDTGARRFNQTRIELVLETRDTNHRDALLAAIAEAGYEPDLPAPGSP